MIFDTLFWTFLITAQIPIPENLRSLIPTPITIPQTFYYSLIPGHFCFPESDSILIPAKNQDHCRCIQFARPTSGTYQFETRTSPFCPEQVPRTCLVISQLPLDPQKSMTYRFVSAFHDKPTYFVRIIAWSLTTVLESPGMPVTGSPSISKGYHSSLIGGSPSIIVI